jgi:uncharacterized protein (DUF169 family)
MSEITGLETFREQGRTLYDKLRLLTHPLAIRFIEDVAEIPKGAFRPSAFGKKMTLCQGFTLSRRSGATVAFTLEDNVCVASSLAHGWEELEIADVLKSQDLAHYYADMESLVKSGMTRKLMPPKQFKGMLIAPLQKTVFEPHVALIYGNPVVMHHLIAALSFHGRVINSNFYITGESCLKGLITPYLTKEPQVVIPGLGDRMNSMTGEDEMAMGIPAELLQETVDNLLVGKIGHPVSSLLPDVPENLTPAWPYLRAKLKEKAKE